MDIAVVGSGGREHALTWSLKNEKKHNIYNIPGNGGTALIGNNIDNLKTNKEILNFLKEKKIEMCVIGPEKPLADGLANILRKNNIITLGPNKDGAMIEKSKVWAKNFMNKYNIPTAEHKVFDDYKKALAYIENKDEYPIVIKADGLAGGKGVFIVNNLDEADESLQKIMIDKNFGSAGNKVEIEQYLKGIEASYLVFMDGNRFKPMVTSKDYKQLLNNDKGPNTGGMGTFSPSPHIDKNLEKTIKKEIIEKALKGFQNEGIDYKGILYAGIMLTEKGPKVLEFNCRFGDPETQVILPRLETPLSEIIHAISESSLNKIDIKWNNNPAVCVIAASEGYPIEYEKGKLITSLDKIKNSIIFHAGTKIVNKKHYTSGGRVLGVTAQSTTIENARKIAYKDMEKITFEGIYYRTDIANM